METREERDQGRTVAFRVPTHVWQQIGALMRERNARASAVLRELVAAGLAVQRRDQGRAADRER